MDNSRPDEGGAGLLCGPVRVRLVRRPSDDRPLPASLAALMRQRARELEALAVELQQAADYVDGRI